MTSLLRRNRRKTKGGSEAVKKLKALVMVMGTDEMQSVVARTTSCKDTQRVLHDLFPETMSQDSLDDDEYHDREQAGSLFPVNVKCEAFVDEVMIQWVDMLEGAGSDGTSSSKLPLCKSHGTHRDQTVTSYVSVNPLAQVVTKQ